MQAKRLILVALALAVLVSCQGKVKKYRLNVVKEYPHDTSSYTQGLFFHDGTLYESTGQMGESTMRIVDLESGEALRKLSFAFDYFLEGSVILDGELFILTWLNKVAFIYDAQTLEYKETYSYPREGWGLTTDGKDLIASDGSSTLYFLDKRFNVKHTVRVTRDGKPVRYLNELEWIDGKIWANIYTTDDIAIINPRTGVVEAMIDCSGLLDRSLRTAKTDVLNGIAVNPADGKIYLTGKYWPKMFEIELVKTK
jgi:glutaminyl-peptide cyclotransferase